jgi:ring-1,2-phenylacetyl-CoA epoxidase subunit PaaE
MNSFYPLTIADIRRETPDAVSLAFAVAPELAEAYRFEPGQYVTLRTTIDGRQVQRVYSICSGVDDGELRVAVKRVENGWFSTFANEALARGQQIEVMPPKGRFGVPLRPDLSRRYVAFASGSGITPIMSLIRSVLRREPQSEVVLFFGNRDGKSILFRGDLEDLKSRYMERLSVFHVLSREGNDVALFSGRLNADKVKAFAGALFDPARTDAFFICGPGQMNGEIEQALATLGVPADRIRKELFVAEGSEPLPARTARARGPAAKSAVIETIIDGNRKSFPMGEDDASVIDAGHRHGVELPSSCKGGMCSTCRAKVVEGSVKMTFNYALEPWEAEAGYVLACQARPTSERVVLDFDHV